MSVYANESLQLNLFHQLEDGALDACHRLKAICHDQQSDHVELRQKFLSAIGDIEKITIRNLAREHGAFKVIDGVLQISEAPISHLLAVVVNSIDEEIDKDISTLDGVELPNLLERVFVQYVLHELRHRSQGLEDYEKVQAIKSMGASDVIADYDALADRDAASAVAALYAKNGNRSAYLEAFRDALFFSTNYFFEVFPIPATRKDKISRAISVLFMAARVAVRDLASDDVIEENPEFPLDAPLHVSLSIENKTLLVHLGGPDRKIIGFAQNDDGVGDLIDQISMGDYQAAIETSTRVMDRMNLL